MGWWKDFANSLVETTAAGLTSSLATGVSGEKSGLGSMLSEGTQSDFDKYVSARQAAVKGEYDKYTQKFDAFEEQAKQFAGLVGSPSSQNLGTELDGMEVAARYMQGKSQSQINDTIAQLKKLKAEGKNIREARPDLFKRGADQEIRNYTAQDIARMQLGGAFSYTPKPYDLSKRRTGLARFLRDDLGLYGETFAKEREAVAERQARDITAALPNFEKYSSTGGGQYTKAQAGFEFGAGDLRTEEEIRAEQRSISDTEAAELRVEQLEQSIELAKSQEARAKEQEKRAQAESEARLTNLGLEQDTREIQLEEARLKRKQNQSALHKEHVSLLEAGQFKQAGEVKAQIDRNAAIMGTEEEVDNYVKKRIAEDPTFGKAYKAGIPATKGSAAIGQEGYSPEVRKAKITGFRVRGMVATLDRIVDKGDLDALDAISNNGFGTLDFSRKDVADMKNFVVIRALATEKSEKGDTTESKVQKGIEAYLEREGIEPTEENIARVKDDYNKIARTVGGSVVNSERQDTDTPPPVVDAGPFKPRRGTTQEEIQYGPTAGSAPVKGNVANISKEVTAIEKRIEGLNAQLAEAQKRAESKNPLTRLPPNTAKMVMDRIRKELLNANKELEALK